MLKRVNEKNIVKYYFRYKLKQIFIQLTLHRVTCVGLPLFLSGDRQIEQRFLGLSMEILVLARCGGVMGIIIYSFSSNDSRRSSLMKKYDCQ